MIVFYYLVFFFLINIFFYKINDKTLQNEIEDQFYCLEFFSYRNHLQLWISMNLM